MTTIKFKRGTTSQVTAYTNSAVQGECVLDTQTSKLYVCFSNGTLTEVGRIATQVGTADVGGATQPIYLDGGVPAATTYTLGKSVPADAVFTDTTYSTMAASGSSHAGGLVPDPGATQGTTKFLCEDATWKIPVTNLPSVIDCGELGAS